MPQNSVSILSTRSLTDSLVEQIASKRVSIDVLSFIHTEPIEGVEVQQEIEQAYLQQATVVFTSGNAIEAVGRQVEQQDPAWRIYTLNSKCQHLAAEYFGEDKIAGTAANAEALAELIIEEASTDEVIFFCGDQRRDELPDKLRQHGIGVFEIEVYHTVAVPHKVKKHYDGILFFSPSAVKSFFSVNKADQQTILFAIGETTAKEIKKHSANKILVGENPDKESLVKEMLDFFELTNDR